MIVLLLIILLALAAALVTAVYLLGFRLGGEHWLSELARIRVEAAHAERQLHDLTCEAFVTMAERLEAHRRDG